MNQVSIEETGLLKIDENELELSMQIDMDGFSFCLKHISENKIVALQHIQNQELKPLDIFFNEVWSSNKLLNNRYAAFRLMYTNTRVTLIPDALFKEQDAAAVYAYNFHDCQKEKLKTSRLNKCEAHAIFGIPETFIETVNNYVPCTWIPHILPFIESNLINFKLSDDQIHPIMYVECHNRFIDLLVVDGSGVKLYNNFSVQSDKDIIYFILNIFDKLSLDAEKVQVIFSGNISTESASVITLQKFIRHVFFTARRSDLKFTYRMQEIAPHLFSNLLNLAVCEL